MDMCILDEKVVELESPDLFVMGDNPSHSKQLPHKEKKAPGPTLVEKRNLERKKPRYMPGPYILRLSNPEAFQRLMLDPDYDSDDELNEDPDEDHHIVYKNLANPFERLTESVSDLVFPTDEASSYPLMPDKEKKPLAPTLVENRNSKLLSAQPSSSCKKPIYRPGPYILRLSNPEAFQRLMLDPNYDSDDELNEDPDDDHHIVYKKLTDPFELLTASVSNLVLPTDETSSYPLMQNKEKKTAPAPTIVEIRNSKIPSAQPSECKKSRYMPGPYNLRLVKEKKRLAKEKKKTCQRKKAGKRSNAVEC